MTVVAHEAARLAREARVRKIAGFGCAAADVVHLYPEFLFVGLSHDRALLAREQAKFPQALFWEYNAASGTPSPLYLGDAVVACAIDEYGDPARVFQKMQPALGVVVTTTRPPGEIVSLASEHLPGFVFTAQHDATRGETVVSGTRVRKEGVA